MSKTSVSVSKSESKYFNEEYQDDVVSELKKGKEFAYSYNEVQFDKIQAMAEEIADKKEKKVGVKFEVRHVNFGEGDNEKSSIVGWKVVEMPAKKNA